MIKALFRFMELQEELTYQGDYLALKKHLETTQRSYNVEEISREGFKVYAENSLGTFIGHSYGINAMVYIKSSHDNPLRLKFRAHLRLEVIFVLIMAFVFFVAIAAKGAEASIWGLVIPPTLVFLFWGWYRIQERMLLSEFKKTLGA